MAQLNAVQQRAALRNKALTEGIEKLKAKIKSNPDNPKIPLWQNKIKEYQESLLYVALEYKTGQPVRRNDQKQSALIKTMIDEGVNITNENIPAPSDGLVVNPPAGDINLKSEAPGTEG